MPGEGPRNSDPFGTAELRRVVLAGWAASPTRFREDANAEEALAIGGYAGRVLVELASNAVDAARELGVPARIRVRLAGEELRMANTGAALTADGVAALASLRASAKRETLDSVGHFGVGFTAVLSWSHAPTVISADGGVRFDAALTSDEITGLGVPALDRELLLRGGRAPVLRLPWPVETDERPPAGYATEVRLPLQAGPRAEVERILANPDTAEDLFWALSDLVEIDLPDRVMHCGIDSSGSTVIADGVTAKRYRTADRVGEIPAELLADRPIEERRRTNWRITWALPIGTEPVTSGSISNGSITETANINDTADAAFLRAVVEAATIPVVATMIGAPTPTDEPLTLPARLIGTFPVDDTRRRLAGGPLCDYLLDRAADTYLDLLATTPAEERWSLLPTGGFPAGPIDGALREAVLRRVAVTPLFRTAAGDFVTPDAACQLPGLGGEGAALLGQAIPGLLPPQRNAATNVLRGLGVSTLSWADASSALAGIDRDATFWWHVYDAISSVDRPPDPEDLADIPIPLTGGRRTLGARGCLLPDPDPALGAGAGTRIDAELARRVGEVVPALRIVDPRAAHPFLERLGARPADPDTLLADPGLTAAIAELRGELEDADPDPDDVHDLAAVVLDLLSAGGRAGRDALSDLVLTDLDGQPWPASELLLPGAALAAVLGADTDRPVIDENWTDRYPADVLQLAGVRNGFAIVTVSDPPDDDVDLPDLDEWLDTLAGSDRPDDPVPASGTGSFRAIADLDLVDPERWPQALELITTDRDARDALITPGPALSYSGWWLSRHALIGGRAPKQWRLPTAEGLDGLYEPLPLNMDPLVARAIGVRSDLAQAAADDPAGLLDRLADPARRVSPGRVAGLTAVLVAALGADNDIDLPSGVRAITGDVVDADDACVLDLPWLAQVLPASRLVPGGDDPGLVARVFDLPLASALIRATVVDADRPADAVRDDAARQLRARLERAAAATDCRLQIENVVLATSLRVQVDGGEPIAVRWWCTGDRYWVDGSAGAAGRAMAWAAGLWPARHRAAAAADENWVALAEDGLG